jgi:hypothetical protein
VAGDPHRLCKLILRNAADFTQFAYFCFYKTRLRPVGFYGVKFTSCPIIISEIKPKVNQIVNFFV